MPSALWSKFAKSKRYREEFVAAQVKRLIPLQIRRLLKQHEMSQETLAEKAGVTQGVVSRAANPEYGNLTINTLVRIAAGFDVAFVGRFIPFTELDRLLNEFSDESLRVGTFEQENRQIASRPRERHGAEESTAITEASSTEDSHRTDMVRFWDTESLDNPLTKLQAGDGQIPDKRPMGAAKAAA